ncbi:MAG TPA: DASS family sodium-coupled anion symporter [Bacillus sp. (in: firmicutes)]|nr:DASS family sodium-coupled anion symporter [Bacillus sp. (in: firmicutes)]
MWPLRFLLNSNVIFLLINLFSWILVLYIPFDHAKMFIVLLFALSGWAIGNLPQPIISLSLILYLDLLGIAPFSEGLEGYSQPFVWLLVATFIIAAAFEHTGLGRRIALLIFSLVKGSRRASVTLVMIALTVLSFLIPTGAGRIAMILPVCLGLIEVVKEETEEKSYAKNILLGVTFTSSIMSFSLITGSSSSVYAASAIKTLTGYSWDYLTWLLVHFPIALAYIISLLFILRWRFPIDKNDGNAEKKYIEMQLAKLGKIKKAEIKLIIISLIMITGWITESIHHYSVAMVAMFSALLCCFPFTGVQTWKQANSKIDWNIIILFGAAYALAEAMQTNGTADWMASFLADFIPAHNPLWAALVVVIMIVIFRLGFANMLGVTAVFLPLTISLADVLSINPVWLAQIVIITCSFGYFLPSQSPANLMTYSVGEYSKADLLIIGIFMIIITIPLLFLFAFYYWPFIGLNPY